MELGGRSLDVLITLLAHPNEVISKRKLLAQVWPDAIVEEGSLRFHIASLRKALGDGSRRRPLHHDGCRSGLLLRCACCAIGGATRPWRRNGLPPARASTCPAACSGWSDVRKKSDNSCDQLAAERFVTIVGSGGVGKTTVAIAVGHNFAEDFDGTVLFVDLGSISDPPLIATTLATMLGLSVQGEDALTIVIAHLRDSQILLILDTCEHLVDALATLTSRLFAAAPQVHILATSREALRADGEHVFMLAPLPCPPDDPTLTVSAVEAFPAALLFLDRARASGARGGLQRRRRRGYSRYPAENSVASRSPSSWQPVAYRPMG